MYEQDLLQTTDRDQLITTLNKMAVIYEDRLERPATHAIECMRRILDLASGSPAHDPQPGAAVRARRPLPRADRDARPRGLARRATPSRSSRSTTATRRSSTSTSRTAPAPSPRTSACWRCLPRTCPRSRRWAGCTRRSGRWDELIDMYRAEAEISPSTEQAASLIYKIGELYEQKLKSENEAIASYQEALTLAPSYFPALRALARIYRAARRVGEADRGAARRGRQPHRPDGARQRALPGRRHLGGPAPAARAGHRGLPGGAAPDAGPRRRAARAGAAVHQRRTTSRSWSPSWTARRRWARRRAPRWPRT